MALAVWQSQPGCAPGLAHRLTCIAGFVQYDEALILSQQSHQAAAKQ